MDVEYPERPLHIAGAHEELCAIQAPSHYNLFEGLEAIQLIAGALTESEFYGYCLGNTLKYRLRAGKKGDDIEIEIGKADFYQELYTMYKHTCKDSA